MRRLFIILTILAVCSISVYAATYKINTKGVVTNPQGKVQTNSSSLQSQPANPYNTYTAPAYVDNKIVLSNQVGVIDIVMDYSGSMSYWINAAKSTMGNIVYQIPQSTKIGFRAFGQNSGNNPYYGIVEKAKKVVKDKNGNYKAIVGGSTKQSYLGSTSGSCSATIQVVPVSTYNAATLLYGMNATKIGGATPLTYALHQAVNSDFANLPTNYTKKIILITDGDETCGGDPCAFARNLVATRKDIIIDVVLVSSYSNKLQCLSNATGGSFYTTNSLSTFNNAIINSITTTPAQTSQPAQQPQPQTQQYEYIGN